MGKGRLCQTRVRLTGRVLIYLSHSPIAMQIVNSVQKSGDLGLNFVFWNYKYHHQRLSFIMKKLLEYQQKCTTDYPLTIDTLL